MSSVSVLCIFAVSPDVCHFAQEGQSVYQHQKVCACGRNGAVGWLPNNLNQGRLDYYYVVLVIMSVLNIFFFIFVARLYKYKKVRHSLLQSLQDELTL